ncbi:MAG: hypothetical protein ACI9MC_002743 [Kiritimatiellia bacterium]|jgi:hypothetical protein
MSEPFAPAEPHGALEPIFADAWFLTGSVQFKPLVRLVRNMVVLRHDGELTLINSVRLDDAGLAALDALGKVSHVMRIGGHGMDDAYYLDRYGARHWTASDLQPDTELPVPGLQVFRFNDTIAPEAALLLDRDGGLLITCDSVQHWVPSALMSPIAKLLTRLMGFQRPAQIGPPWRKKQTPAGGSLREDFERLAALPFDKLIGGHGGLLQSDGAAVVRASVARTFSA